MHRWFSGRLRCLPEDRGSKLCVIAPRGNAKSTWGTLFFPLYCALEGLENYIWIISDTIGQADAHLSNIGAELLENEELQRAYPSETKGARVKAGDIQLGNGVRIQAFSTGQKLRGRRKKQHRPSLVVLDDPQNDEHVVSPEQRAKHWDWLTKALLKAGNLRTNFLVLGTALHRECIVCRLQQTPGWESRKFQAIQRWPTRMDLWAEWEQIYSTPENPERAAAAREFFRQHEPSMTDGSSVLWPDYEPLYDLMRMRAEEGHASFECEKQSNPINPDACEWPESYFGDHIWFDEWPENPGVVLAACDPSKGAGAKLGDYSAIVWGVEKDGILYLDASLQRRPSEQLVVDYVGICRQWAVHACSIETNQFQELLVHDLEQESQRQGYVMPLVQVVNSVNKEVRIRRIGPYLSCRRLRFRRGSPGALLLVNQLRDFPIGDHDDGPDALEMWLRLGAMVTGGQVDDAGDRLRIEVR